MLYRRSTKNLYSSAENLIFFAEASRKLLILSMNSAPKFIFFNIKI